MKTSKALTKTQLTNLLLTAYAFVDKNGEILMTDKFLIDPLEFKLQTSDYDLVEFSYDNATFIDGVATFETHDGDTESFKVLVVAVGYSL
jgi:hypothetical protein